MIIQHLKPVGWVDTAEDGLIQPSEVAGLVHVVTLEPGDLIAGPQGPQGVPGADGAPGAAGAQGLQGLPGAKGDTGAQGAPGLPGAAGAQGLKGLPGAKGDTGEQGLPGAAGAQGLQGLPGAKGDTGAQGAPGLPGAAGAQGLQGLPGAKGDTGAQGLQGVKGDTGAAGVGIVVDPVVFGFGAGAGGTVAQAAAKSAGVTINKPCGRINVAAELLSGIIQFNVSNNLVNASSVVIVSMVGSGSLSEAAYTIDTFVGSGFFGVTIKNQSGAALAEAIPLNFIVLSAAVA